MQLIIYLHRLYKNVEVRTQSVIVRAKPDVLFSDIVEALVMVPGMEYPFKVLKARDTINGHKLKDGWLNSSIKSLFITEITIVYS